MKKIIGKGKELFNLTSIVIGAFLLTIGIVIGIILNSSLSFAINTDDLKYGDLNCDGEITSADSVLLARAVRGDITLTANQKLAADLNADGIINELDESILARYIINYDNITFPYTGSIKEITYGDINLDGTVSSADSVLLIEYLTNNIELTDEQKLNADVNIDGKIDGYDADTLSRYLAGKLTSLPYIMFATPSNATNSNATSSNAYTNDNVLYLDKMQIFDMDKELKPGDELKLFISTVGACRKAANIYIVGKNSGMIYNLDVKSLNDNPYIELPSDIVTDEYSISKILIVGLNSDKTTFTKIFENELNIINSDVLNIKNSNKQSDIPLELYEFKLNSEEVNAGEIIKVDFKASESLFGMNLKFKSATNNEFTTYINRYYINVDPKFTVSSNVIPDNYELVSITIMTTSETKTYTKGDNLNYDIKLAVKENNKKIYRYYNDEITESLLTNIHNYDSGVTINIDANKNSIISSELFNSIKGSSKDLVIEYQGNEIIFCGKDITDPKTIDAKIVLNTLEENKEISGFVKDGIVVNLSSNGTLPGKAKYRIYATDEIKESIGNKNIYLYYYDADNNNFNLIQTNVKLTSNYYELNISHNSKYVLTKTKIDSKYVVKDGNNIVNFQNSNTINLLLIAGGILLILVVIIVIILVKKKTNKEKSNK